MALGRRWPRGPAVVVARRACRRCDLVQVQQPLGAVRQPDEHHAVVEEQGGIASSVVSWPPCWLAVELKALPTLPISAPAAHNPPVGS